MLSRLYTSCEVSLSPHAPQDAYTRRIALQDAGISTHERTSGRFSSARLLVAGVALAIAAPVMRGTLSAWWLLAPALGFLALVVGHARVIDRIDRARRARAWYEHGLARITGQWAGRGADGRRFLEGQPFAGDLDLFGRGSVFQLLSTARTEAGEDTLARWLLVGAQPDEIRARQAAVEELRPKLDFRESLAVTTVAATTSRTRALLDWARTAGAGFGLGTGALFATIGLISGILLVATFRSLIDGRLFLLWLGLQAATVIAFWRRSQATLGRIDMAAQDLELLAAVLARVEGQQFQTPRLHTLLGTLSDGGATPSRRIAHLLRLVTALDSTRNQIAAPLAWLLMVPYLLGVAIDRWHAENSARIPVWLDTVGELEAFSALATYAYEHPDDVFPEVVAAGPTFDATGLGHPLIATDVAVRNDVAIGGAHPHLLLVSGSNMSGKSTLLRAIGVNVTLALAGAHVRATSLRLSPMTLGTSLRIEDSLQAGHSRFYAEILRIRAVVELTRHHAQVLFLLDEMLAGTNSHDRRIGAEAIIRTLVADGAIGLVTTHDLALADVVPSLGALATNVHFEDRIENGTMVFDYHMRPGVVQHSNALALMRAVGLEV